MKEFFEAFSIKKVRECELRDECFLGFAHTCDKCDIYGQAYEIYPSITSDIVLNLATILNKEVFSKIECCCLFCGQNIEEITKNILDDCIDHQKDIYTQVRALFNAD